MKTKLKPEASLSKIKSTKSKILTKTQPNMDGEEFLADSPKKGKITKPNSKTLDGEKFLSKEKKIKSFESFVNENYTSEDNKFHYMFLNRLQSNCEYFLGYGNGSERVLPSGKIETHIAKMKEIWEKLPVKPEWLTYEQIEDYEKRMLDLRENPKPYWNPDDVIVK